ncbi:isochorismatase family protein [Oceanospirillaceae bacterium]|jgi:nicotinamidase-related amidase|nr:isochorismatase family protein [Oceanospirillaceae bacterium]MDB4536899.1 isochorismatase family protein [Oceanospirillaceae bacterium]MDC0085702.1 isochorismatase family protein [Oceanospirillaceae bacterium]MDC1351241.1 isochorismatase family protein [Oceanospirillaceae bacterium]MDC1424619.1 isochorismatase family protein [Oceanospirillaceae bacterium]|tara:strand:- start:4399 stop:4947 length:549 start_codon:yes stop_codon:yes gene_type:complete
MKTALLVIDVQMAFVQDDANGASRSNPSASDNIATLLSEFRQRGDKVIHIHHHGQDPSDPFNPNAPGSAVQAFAAPLESEDLVIKLGGSGFVGTSLESILREAKIERLVVCGATANHCAESTTRSASDLGFDTYYVADGVWAYSVTGPDGIEHSADQVHSVTLSTLHGEFATVISTLEVLAI